MSDTVSGVRQLIHDLIAPDLQANSAKLDALRKQIEMLQKHVEAHHDASMATTEALRAEMRSEFASLRANSQKDTLRQVGPISGRLAVVEARTLRD
jgi:hypothetical protein